MVVGGPGRGPAIPQDGGGVEMPQGCLVRPGGTNRKGFC